MSTERAKPIRLGGVLYSSETPERHALRDFALDLKKRGWHVAGLVQETLYDDQGLKIGLDAVDLHSGQHLPLSRPTKQDRENGHCAFDVGLLTDTTAVLREATVQNADLIVVEKFGEREQDGRGLADEILKAAIAGIPILVAVPAHALEGWNEYSGRMGVLLPHDKLNLQDWWPKWNIYKELALPIPHDDVIHIEIGANAILVEGPNGCGVTANPTGTAHASQTNTLSLRDLALQAHDRLHPQDHAIAVAALLAHHNRYDLSGSDESGLNHFKGRNENILMVGSFAKDKTSANNTEHIPSQHALQHLIEYAYDGVVLPSHTFGDGLLPSLLRAKGFAETVLVGPETPLCPQLFDYGLNVLSGRIIIDAPKARALVRNGASPKDLKSVSRYITLKKQ